MDQQDFNKVYPSKKDLWIVIVLWICALLLFCFSIFCFTVITLVHTPGGIVLGLVILLSGLMTVHIIYKTNYTLTDKMLIVCSSLFKTRVSLDEIKEVFPTRSIVSGAALSTDRLNIKYGKATFGLLISPENKDEFLTDLAGLRDNLKLEEGKVVRA